MSGLFIFLGPQRLEDSEVDPGCKVGSLGHIPPSTQDKSRGRKGAVKIADDAEPILIVRYRS